MLRGAGGSNRQTLACGKQTRDAADSESEQCPQNARRDAYLKKCKPRRGWIGPQTDHEANESTDAAERGTADDGIAHR